MSPIDSHCEICGEYCAEYGRDMRVAERHGRWAERYHDCSERHVGPWHTTRGRRIEKCAWCRGLAEYKGEDRTLDHADCPECRAPRQLLRRRRPAGWRSRSTIFQHVERAMGAGLGDLLEATAQEELARRLLAQATETGPADRGRAERALATYFGRGRVRVTWHPSPVALGRALAAAVEASGYPLDREGSLPAPWSFRSLAPHEVRLTADGGRWPRDARVLQERLRDIERRMGAIAFALARVAGIGELAGAPLADAGQFDAASAVVASYLATGGADAIADGGYLAMMAELRASAGPALLFHSRVHLSERPLILRLDEAGRLHSDDGPAIAYGDGSELWVSHGIVVPDWLIRDPDRLTVEAIDGERNVEVRRAMVERFGADRLVREGCAELVHEDGTGRLWRRALAGAGWSEEPIAMVEVVNATPEPDGSRRTYFLRVPPTVRTATEAVAWTFGLREREYAPERQT